MQVLKEKVRNLIESLSADISRADCAKSQVKCTQTILQRFIGQLKVSDFDEVHAKQDCYARHLLYRCPKEDFSVVMMVWGPGQRTPVHDHGGHWCVEGVVKGQLEIVDYSLREIDAQTVELNAEKTIHASPGDVGNLIPPFEYHHIANFTSTPAISIHVYSSEIKTCTRFLPLENNRYQKETVSLCYDSAL